MDKRAIWGIRNEPLAADILSHLNSLSRTEMGAYPATLAIHWVYNIVRIYGMVAAEVQTLIAGYTFFFVYESRVPSGKRLLRSDGRL
jgi:hypothetical protein